MNPADERWWMGLAIELAKKGRYTTDPNPCVGCVIVKNNKLISEGWHQKLGEDHAEINALKNIIKGENAVDSMMFVSLEPCFHDGKTPPCVNAIINAKIKKVLIAMLDPNPLVAGKSVNLLKQSGITVSVGLMATQASYLNRGFIKRMTKNLPFVTLKSAMSFDGRTAMKSGESKWITGEKSRSDVQKLRAESSAIITGIGTILADNPQMTVRELTIEKQPMRVILDDALTIPLNANILKNNAKVLIFSNHNDTDKIAKLKKLGVSVVLVGGNKRQLNLIEILNYLAKNKVNSILVEAGATLTASFIKQKLVDEVIVYMAPKLLGGKAKPLFDLSLDRMNESVDLHIKNVDKIGNDFKFIFALQDTSSS